MSQYHELCIDGGIQHDGAGADCYAGPGSALVTGCAARDGTSSALRTMMGSNLASLVLMAVAAAMLTGAVAIHPDILLLLAALGSLYITWLALSMLRAPHMAPGAATARGGVWSDL